MAAKHVARASPKQPHEVRQLTVTVVDTCRLISAGADQYLVVHVVFPDSTWSWGVWCTSTRGTYDLVLGPLPSYLPCSDGLAELGITDWTYNDVDFPTPSDLPLDNYTQDSLTEHPPPPPPPPGSRVAFARAKRHRWLPDWLGLRGILARRGRP